MKFDKILVLQQNALGDVVLSTGVLKALREKFPQSRIAFLVSPETADLVRLPFVDEVIPYTKGMPMLPVIRKIWRYNAAICLDFKYRSAVVPFLGCIPVRAGLAHKRKLFLTHAVERQAESETVYFAEYLADVIYQTVGIELDREHSLTQLYVAEATDSDKKAVDLLLKADAMKVKIAIAPFSSTTAKDWPVEYYRALIERLSKIENVEFLILGGKKDREIEFPAAENIFDFRGKAKLTETAELLRRADYFIGGCSAPLHIAAAVGTPAVALYGATSPNKWAPRHRCIHLEHPQECTPCDRICYGGACNGQNTCMKAITVDEVYTALQKLMQEYPRE
jgi:lipopolysaccharide heptosyltransferase II